MIIKGRPINPFFFKFCRWLVVKVLKRRFNKLVVSKAEILPNHSYLLLCNHFSFIDGVFVYYLCREVFWNVNNKTRVYTMVQKKQVEKNMWIRNTGCFSIDARSKTVFESFDYAAELLSQPGNLVLMFPQGNLESIHVDRIKFQEGIKELVKRIKGDCQLVWSSNITEFFESSKPSVYFNMLDCGTNHNFDFDLLKEKVNEFHRSALRKYVRFTKPND